MRMRINRPFSAKRLSRLCCALFLAGTLNGCDDQSTSSTDSKLSSSRSVTDSEIPSTGNNGNGQAETPNPTPISYERAEEYPAMTSLPMQYIRLSSGKKIALQITLPADAQGNPAAGPFPVIVVQTAYNINLMGKAIPAIPIGQGPDAFLSAPDEYIIKRGYAYVAVDVLGSGASDGRWELINEEEQAAYGETIDWVSRQPWSNGKLGAAGASYMAISALISAASRPEAIKAVFAAVPMGDSYRSVASTGGLLNALFLGTWIDITQTTTVTNSATIANYPQYAADIQAATQEHINQIDEYFLPLYERAMSGDPELTYDGPFWRTRSPIETLDAVRAPTFIIGATNDIFQRDEPLLYERLRANGVDTRLAIYDGDHVSNFTQQLIGNQKLGPTPRLMLMWFDKYLKDMNSGVEKIPAVTQYVKGYADDQTKSFSTAADWPHPQARAERWFLHGDLTLSQLAPTQEETRHAMATPEFEVISAAKSKSGKLLDILVEPKDGTRCSISYRQWTLGIASATNPAPCYAESSELEKEAINFETVAFSEDFYINGPIQADIWIESNVTEAVLSVRVDEVAGDDSFVKPITNGLLLASARAVDESRSRYLNNEMIQPYHPFTQEAELPVVPGEVMKLSVEVFPTSALIRAGNKLRISVAPSNQAQGALNTPRKEKARGGITQIHISPSHPSSLVLPVVPTSELN